MEDATNIANIVPRRVTPLASARRSVGPTPDCPVFVIGALRGQLDAFAALLDRIEYEMKSPRLDGARVVVLGDLVHGAERGALLSSLRRAEQASGGQLIVLMGRRDKLLLDYLKHPNHHGAAFLSSGGRELLEGLDIPLGADVTAVGLRLAAGRIEQALGRDDLAWLARRPLFWRTGDLVCAHAGLDPFRPLSQQSETYVLNAHPQFHSLARRDGYWVVHAEPGGAGGVRRGRRIAVGGGLIRQLRIDAVRIEPGAPVAFMTSDDELHREAS